MGETFPLSYHRIDQPSYALPQQQSRLTWSGSRPTCGQAYARLSRAPNSRTTQSGISVGAGNRRRRCSSRRGLGRRCSGGCRRPRAGQDAGSDGGAVTRGGGIVGGKGTAAGAGTGAAAGGRMNTYFGADAPVEPVVPASGTRIHRGNISSSPPWHPVSCSSRGRGCNQVYDKHGRA